MIIYLILNLFNLEMSDGKNTGESPKFDINSFVKGEVDKILDKNSSQIIDTLVLSGGSLKGIAQMGALHYLEKIGILGNITTYAGTSAGAVICAVLSLGYRPSEIYHFFMNIDMSKMSKINAYNFFNKLGLDDGKRFNLVIKKYFTNKSVNPKITFAEHYKMTGKELIITGTCVNDKKVHYFSWKTAPDMRIIDALRISISVPILYTPRKHAGKVFVDGGCIDNYPISMFSHKLDKVIGIHVNEDKQTVDKIDSIESFLQNTIECLKEGMTINAIRGYEGRTISIDCESGEDRITFSAMFDKGHETAVRFCKDRGYV